MNEMLLNGSILISKYSWMSREEDLNDEGLFHYVTLKLRVWSDRLSGRSTQSDVVKQFQKILTTTFLFSRNFLRFIILCLRCRGENEPTEIIEVRQMYNFFMLNDEQRETVNDSRLVCQATPEAFQSKEMQRNTVPRTTPTYPVYCTATWKVW